MRSNYKQAHSVVRDEPFFMTGISDLYRILNLLSIDVSAGAVVCAGFFSSVFGIPLKPYAYIALGVTVWIIYTADHLLDAKRLSASASTKRHQFHQKHFTVLLVLTTIAACVDTILVLIIRKPLLEAGLILSLFVGLYLLIQRYLAFLKEFAGALLYTAGVSLPVISLEPFALNFNYVLLLIQFMITAWLNLLLFSLFDRHLDLEDKHISFATIWGESKTKRIIILLFAGGVLLGIFQLMRQFVWPPVILMVMQLMLLIIFTRRAYFEKNDRFRLWGDAIFLLPAIYFFF